MYIYISLSLSLKYIALSISLFTCRVLHNLYKIYVCLCVRVCDCVGVGVGVCVCARTHPYNKRFNFYDAGGCRESHSSAANEDGYDIPQY